MATSKQWNPGGREDASASAKCQTTEWELQLAKVQQKQMEEVKKINDSEHDSSWKTHEQESMKFFYTLGV